MNKTGSSGKVNIVTNRFVKAMYILLGSIFLVLGIIGAFLPILPTTPFLLLAAGCYARSSKRFYNWLINNKIFGSYIKNYREGHGVTLILKITTLLLVWGTIIYSVFFVIENVYVRILLLVIACGVSTHVLTIKTMKKK